MTVRNHKPDIVIASHDDNIGYKIADKLGISYEDFRKEYYPDGSPGPKIDMRYDHNKYEDFDGKHILTVYRRKQLPVKEEVAKHLSNYPRIAATLIEEELFNAGQVDFLYPYWITGRSDHNPRTDPDPDVRRDDKGRGMEFMTDARIFEAANVNTVLTFHPHFHREPGLKELQWKQKGKDWIVDKNDYTKRSLDVVCLDAVPLMIDYATKEFGLGKGKWQVLNPGRKKDYEIAHEFAKNTGLDVYDMPMGRTSTKEKTALDGKFDAKGNNIIIVDDILSTCGTIETAMNSMENYGDVYVVAVHPVLPEEGFRRIRHLIKSHDFPLRGAAATHTIDSDYAEIPIHKPIKEYYENPDELRENKWIVTTKDIKKVA